MLKIKDLRKNYIDKALANTGLPIRLYTDTGDYEEATRSYNEVTEYINGLLTVADSSVEYPGTTKEIVSVTTQLKFLVRVNDEHEATGQFPNIEQFRELLSKSFSEESAVFLVNETDDEGNVTKTYSVIAGYVLPASGTREQRSMVGDSFTFTMTVYFAYLSNAVNASSVKISIDGQDVPFLAFQMSRRPSIAANLYSGSPNGESTAYAENTAFVIDLTLPGFVNAVDGIIRDYILGLAPANDAYLVTIQFDGKTVQKRMMFGESSAAGQGIENIRYTVSLVPYFGTIYGG